MAFFPDDGDVALDCANVLADFTQFVTKSRQVAVAQLRQASPRCFQLGAIGGADNSDRDTTRQGRSPPEPARARSQGQSFQPSNFVFMLSDLAALARDLVAFVAGIQLGSMEVLVKLPQVSVQFSAAAGLDIESRHFHTFV
ncbi:hypothetical protein [Oceaniradius stylonematis]|uniref:hypothetical protein n=1 Tax=Oceaniradius stylonematis TaxID=2184161 RepID=UPI003C7EC60A